jgi:hypothetical protein
MTLSYVLNSHSEGLPRPPLFQGDATVGKTIVETPYGYGVIESVNPCFGLVKVAFLDKDFSSIRTDSSVSLPWERIRILPETMPDISREIRNKRPCEDEVEIKKKRS